MPVRTIMATAGIVVLLIGSTAAARDNVEVCHQEGGGGYHIIEVNENAVDAHLNHGDWLVEEEICDDGVDNDCDGDVDVDCCPCFTRADLDFYWPNNDPNWAGCVDYTYDNGYYSHEQVRSQGYEYDRISHQGYIDVFAEQWGIRGPQNYYCQFDAWLDDFQTGDEYTVFVSTYITADEYAVCDENLSAFLEDCELECWVFELP